MQLVDALDRPIAFHRCFVALTGSITAALMLSQALYWSKRSKDPEGWFYKSADEWMEETGLTRSEQEDSRRRLVAYGFISEKRKGMPAILHYKINIEAINLALTTNTVKSLSLDDVLGIFAGPLKNLSNTGWMRAKKLKAPGGYVDYAAVLKAWGMTCSICGNPIAKGPGKTEDALCFDHIVALSRGGSHTMENLAPAHFKCNGQKSDGDAADCVPTVDDQVSLQKRNKSVYCRETSPSTVEKQVRLPKTNLTANGNETSSSTQDEQVRLPETNINRKTETTAEITTETTAEREEDSPALSAINELASALCDLYKIPDSAGWRLKDKFQSLAVELHGLGATVAEIQSFYASRHKKPGAEFFAGDFVTWRASQGAGVPGTSSRTSQRQQASAKAKEILFGGNKR